MLSRKLTMILAVAAVLLFAAVLGIGLAANAAHPGMRVVSERRADPAELLRGGSDSEKPGPVMPGDVININTADAEELRRLPGIGEETFRAAADYIITEDPT